MTARREREERADEGLEEMQADSSMSKSLKLSSSESVIINLRMNLPKHNIRINLLEHELSVMNLEF